MTGREYRKDGTLGGARHGDSYQIHVLMLMYERAASDENFLDFELATEIKSAGKFDDAVLTWKDPGGGGGASKWMFVQVKHKQKGSITGASLFPTREDDRAKGDLSLFKYLLSMYEIGHGSEFEGDKQFVLFSNCALDSSINEWFCDTNFDGEAVLKVPDSNARFLKMCPDEKQIELLLNYTNKDFEELVNTLKAIFIDGDAECKYDILSRYRGALVNTVLLVEKQSVRFAPRFIKNKKLDYSEGLLREQLFGSGSTLEQLQSYSFSDRNLTAVLTSKKDSQNKLPACLVATEAIQLLDSLTFAVHQPDNEILTSTIRQNLYDYSAVQDPSVKDCYSHLLYNTLQRMVHDWLNVKERANYFNKADLDRKLDELNRTVDRSKLDTNTERFKGMMQNLRVSFARPANFMHMFPLVWISSTDRALLSCLKLYHFFDKKCYRFSTFKNLRVINIREQLYDILRNTSFELFLLIKDDGTKFEFFNELLEIIRKNKNIKLILITNNWERARSYFNVAPLIYGDNCTFADFSEQTQAMLMNKTITLQNVEISLDKLFKRGVPRILLKNEILETVITDNVFRFGPELPELKLKCYIPRTISTTEFTKPTKKRRSASDTECDEFDDLLQDDFEIVTKFDEEVFVDIFSQIFSDCKLVLLSAEPGMGKTTFWTKLAQLTKQRYPSSLVLHIRFLDCVNELHKPQDFDNFSNVSKFIHKITQMETTFERSLLAAFLKDSFIFFDGFDELPQHTITNAVNLLRTLQNHAFVFVSTRTHQKVMLEHAKDLSTKTFILEPLNKYEQVELLISACDIDSKETIIPKFIRRSISEVQSNLSQIADNITGVPLMVIMLAEIYRPYLMAYKETGDLNIVKAFPLASLNLLDLFEMFAYNSFRRQLVEKLNLDIRNPHGERMMDRKNYAFKGYMKLHSYLGLLFLVKQQKIKLVIRDEAELEMLREQACLVDSAIVTKYVDDSPYFTHASFSEFFAARCLYEKFNGMDSTQTEEHFVKDENNRNAQTKVVDLFSVYFKLLRDYAMARKFFFLMAQSNENCWPKLETLLRCMRPFPLVWACEENFGELVKRLLTEDASIVDKQIRQRGTVLHISAALGNHQICALLINYKANVNVANVLDQMPLHLAAAGGFHEVASLLISRGAGLDFVDQKSQTALHLAALAGHIKVVRLLVKRGCNVNILDKRNWNALHLAAYNGHTEVVRVLIEKKSNLMWGAAVKNWGTLLGNVARKTPEIASMMVSYLASLSVDKSTINETLVWAVRKNHMFIVKALHESGVDVHEYDAQLKICTYRMALRKRYFSMARFILEKQNGVCEDYPLHAAADAGSLECVEYMLKVNKAEVNALDENGNTPLELAHKRCHTDIVELLVASAFCVELKKFCQKVIETIDKLV